MQEKDKYIKTYISSDMKYLKLCEIKRWASSQRAAHQADPICGKFARQFFWVPAGFS